MLLKQMNLEIVLLPLDGTLSVYTFALYVLNKPKKIVLIWPMLDQSYLEWSPNLRVRCIKRLNPMC